MVVKARCKRCVWCYIHGMQWPVLRQRILLHACYAMSGIDVALCMQTGCQESARESNRRAQCIEERCFFCPCSRPLLTLCGTHALLLLGESYGPLPFSLFFFSPPIFFFFFFSFFFLRLLFPEIGAGGRQSGRGKRRRARSCART